MASNTDNLKQFEGKWENISNENYENYLVEMAGLKKKSEQDVLYWLSQHIDPDGFEVKEIPGKGRGVISTKRRSAGEFLLHYAGEIITDSEGEKRESVFSSGFRFFHYVGKQGFCVDATEESGRLGRLVNHGKKKEINAKMKQLNGQLLLFSIRDIEIGEEILYDYGVDGLSFEKEKNVSLKRVTNNKETDAEKLTTQYLETRNAFPLKFETIPAKINGIDFYASSVKIDGNVYGSGDVFETSKDAEYAVCRNICEKLNLLHSDFFGTVTVLKKDGTDGPIYEMDATLLLIGSSKTCDIIVKKDRAEHFRIEINSVGEAFLIDHVDGKTIYLRDNALITTCGRKLRWSYPKREQKDKEHSRDSEKTKVVPDDDETEEQSGDSDETDEQNCDSSDKTDDQTIDSDEIVKQPDTGFRKFDDSGETMKQFGYTGESDEQRDDIGVTGKQPVDSGEINEKPGDGGKTADQPGDSCKIVEQAIDTGGIFEQLGDSDVNAEQLAVKGKTGKQTGNSVKTIQLFNTGETDEQSTDNGEIVKQLSDSDKTAKQLDDKDKTDEQTGDSDKTECDSCETDEQLCGSGETDDQTIDSDEIVKQPDTGFRKFDDSGETMKQFGYTGESDEQRDDIGVTGKQPVDSGEINEKPGDGGKTADQLGDSCKIVEQAIDTCGVFEQLGDSDVNAEQLAVKGKTGKQTGNSVKTIQLFNTGETDEQSTDNGEIVKQLSDSDKTAKQLDDKDKTDEQTGDSDKTECDSCETDEQLGGSGETDEQLGETDEQPNDCGENEQLGTSVETRKPGDNVETEQTYDNIETVKRSDSRETSDDGETVKQHGNRGKTKQPGYSAETDNQSAENESTPTAHTVKDKSEDEATTKDASKEDDDMETDETSIEMEVDGISEKVEIYREEIVADKQENIFFCGVSPNYGFLMLFKNFTLVESVEEATLLVVETYSGQTDCSSYEFYQFLLGGRMKLIVNYDWIKESLAAGTVLNTDKYTVRGTRFGTIEQNEDFSGFEYQIQGTNWQDINQEQVVKLLNKMGGVSVLTQNDETVIVCADDYLQSSGQCVNKEWLFHCIIKGKILPVNHLQTVVESDSDESQIIDFPALNKVFVQTSGSDKQGKRTTKRQCCIYCGLLDPKLPRHMETFHSTEIEAAKILSLKKGSKERKQQWALLTAKGNSLHNKKVLEQGSGMLIPKYRPTTVTKSENYLPCEYCRMLFVSTDLWKHHLSCVAKPEDEKSAAPTRNSRLLLPVSESIDQHFKESVVVAMKNDIIGQTAKTDPLIIAFGMRRFEKTGKHEHTFNHISCRMRELARLVLAMNKKDSSIKTLKECIKPALWKMLLQTIKEEAGFDPKERTFSSPSYAIKIGHNLKKAAYIMKTEAGEVDDLSQIERLKIFLDMYEDEYDERVASIARESLSATKFNNVKLLPIVEDVAKLSKYLENEIKSITQHVSDSDKLYSYTRLCKLVLAQVILFNRKRSGEAQRLRKTDFLKCAINLNVDDDISKTLTVFEKTLCQTHLRVETRGKRGRKVSILFTELMKQNVDYLLQLQDENKISSEYVFARPFGLLPYRGSDALKEAVSDADLRYKDRITSTSLRKQLATVCQVLNLTENSQDLLARFMGHDIRVHREYYRLPQSTLEVAKVSKILHLLNTGKISEVAGADLNDIDVTTAVEIEELSDVETEGAVNEETTPDEDGRKKGKKKASELGLNKQTEDVDDDNDPDWIASKDELFSSDDDDDDDDDICEDQSIKRKRKKIDSTDDNETDEEYAKTKKRQKKKGKKNGKRCTWTVEEKRCVESAFAKNILLGRLPGKQECQELIDKQVVLRNRSWTMVKNFVRNKIVSMDRKLKTNNGCINTK